MGFLQQFHLVIKYKNDNTNKLGQHAFKANHMKNTSLGTLMHIEPFIHGVCKGAYLEDGDFKEMFQQRQSHSHVYDGDNIVDYHL